MAGGIQTPVVGQVARYEGDYRPHWEIGHIGVRVSPVRKLLAGGLVGVVLLTLLLFGWIKLPVAGIAAAVVTVWMVMPAEDRWSPHFPPEFGGDLDDEGGRIEFEGVVTERGLYGHRGFMNRSVEIVRVLRYEPRATSGSK
jgi:hypothetical protein